MGKDLWIDDKTHAIAYGQDTTKCSLYKKVKEKCVPKLKTHPSKMKHLLEARRDTQGSPANLLRLSLPNVGVDLESHRD